MRSTLRQAAALALALAALGPGRASALQSTAVVLASALSDPEHAAVVTGYVSDPYGRVIFRVTFSEIATGDFVEDAIFFRDGPLIAPAALPGFEADVSSRRYAVHPGRASFSNPGLSPRGFAVFAAEYEQRGDPDLRKGLFVYDGAYTRLALSVGAPVPGAAASFSDFGDPSALSDGRVVFSGYYDASNDGRWAASDGVFALGEDGEAAAVARLDDAAPGFEGGAFAGFGRPKSSPGGRLAFWARVRAGGREEQAIYLYKDGALSAVARKGDQAPGADAVFTSLKSGDLAVNDAGKVAFAACYGDCLTRSGVFLWDGANVVPVAIFRPGDALGSFVAAGRPAITASGAVAFTGLAVADAGLGLFLRDDVYGTRTVALSGEPIDGDERQGLIGDPVADGAEGLSFSSLSDALESRVFLADPAAEPPPGDLNLDGRIGAEDAGIALALGLGGDVLLSDERAGRADADGSGSVDMRDAMAILAAALGR